MNQSAPNTHMTILKTATKMMEYNEYLFLWAYL